ncbi:hypothetical protein [Burkholderia vietnamiensis]|uniref:hypothetical protein n=1 Tax=Burkholderia vietnamiensis TaxID=60552 RepID=UPI000A494984|nr:hypothetical protein [Burkholderia vietnamiensis]
MKTANIAVAVLISLAAIPAFARSSGTGWPVCFQAAQTAVRAIDARNHGYTRVDARRGEAIPSNMQFGNTPQWVVEMIDPHLNAAYAVPASQKVDADSEGDKVFNECKARVARGI